MVSTTRKRKRLVFLPKCIHDTIVTIRLMFALIRNRCHRMTHVTKNFFFFFFKYMLDPQGWEGKQRKQKHTQQAASKNQRHSTDLSLTTQMTSTHHENDDALSLFIEVHDDEDICRFATDAFLAAGNGSGENPAVTNGTPSHSSPSSAQPHQAGATNTSGETSRQLLTPQPASPANRSAANSFAEQLGVFAKSLSGMPSDNARSASCQLDEVVRLRSTEATKNAEDCVQRIIARSKKEFITMPPEQGGDADDQLNDERVQQSFVTNSQVTEVFDPTFRFCFEVPTKNIVHLPPARLNITRLVFCRNYVPGEAPSCSMAESCKFVHADVDFRTLEAHPIHVKYAWRHEDLCTYARLPAGEVLRVTAPNNRPPVEEIPSERVLVTRGSLRRQESNAPLSHCAHYYFNRMCNRGERCNFIHVVHVDSNVVGDFKRAPCCKPKSSVVGGDGDGALQYGDSPPWAAIQSDRRSVGSGRNGVTTFKPNSDAKPFEPKRTSDEEAATPYQPAPPSFSTPTPGGVAAPSTIAVQMPRQTDSSPQTTAQYGMLVFVPCDAKQRATAISPAVLNPPSAQTGGVASIHVLPTTALDLMHAAYPGLSDRWSTVGEGPTTQAEVLMRPNHGAITVQQQASNQQQQLWYAQQQQQQGEWVVGGEAGGNTPMYADTYGYQQPMYGQSADFPSRRVTRSRGGGGGVMGTPYSFR
jgi:hypothetical protein